MTRASFCGPHLLRDDGFRTVTLLSGLPGGRKQRALFLLSLAERLAERGRSFECFLSQFDHHALAGLCLSDTGRAFFDAEESFAGPSAHARGAQTQKRGGVASAAPFPVSHHDSL